VKPVWFRVGAESRVHHHRAGETAKQCQPSGNSQSVRVSVSPERREVFRDVTGGESTHGTRTSHNPAVRFMVARTDFMPERPPLAGEVAAASLGPAWAPASTAFGTASRLVGPSRIAPERLRSDEQERCPTANARRRAARRVVARLVRRAERTGVASNRPPGSVPSVRRTGGGPASRRCSS
jgi:hypothetical protein